jgi:hypothetical protein
MVRLRSDAVYDVTPSADVPHGEGEVQLVSQKPWNLYRAISADTSARRLNLDHNMDWLNSSSPSSSSSSSSDLPSNTGAISENGKEVPT